MRSAVSKPSLNQPSLRFTTPEFIAPSIVINEIHFDEDDKTVRAEFIELYNPSENSVDLSDGARVALPRVVDLIDGYEIPASFFFPAVSLMLNPGMADVIKRSGRHEFAIHGWIHEQNSSLPRDEEKRLLQQAVDYLAEVTGERPGYARRCRCRIRRGSSVAGFFSAGRGRCYRRPGSCLARLLPGRNWRSRSWQG